MVREAAPTFFTHPPLGDSIGDDVADWVGSLQLGNGEFFVPDENQRALLRAMFAGPAGVTYQTRDKKWASSQVAIVAPRQNLKTATLEMGVAAAVWLLDCRLCVWTAHLYNPAAAETFLHFKELIDCNPHLSRNVKRVLEASGGQGIELMNGARIKFQARSKNAGRSLSAGARMKPSRPSRCASPPYSRSSSESVSMWSFTKAIGMASTLCRFACASRRMVCSVLGPSHRTGPTSDW